MILRFTCATEINCTSRTMFDNTTHDIYLQTVETVDLYSKGLISLWDYLEGLAQHLQSLSAIKEEKAE